MKSLTLFDYSDRELLIIVDELALTDGDWRGWTRSADLAERLGITSDSPTQAVGARMAWLKRYGAVTNPQTASGYWKATPIGRGLMSGEVSPTMLAQLNSLSSADMVVLTRWLGKKQHRAAKTAGHLIRREWTRETVTRPSRNGSKKK